MVKLNSSAEFCNQFHNFEEDEFAYLKWESDQFIEALSDYEGINAYPSFNEIEHDLNIKKSYKFNFEAQASNKFNESTQSKHLDSDLICKKGSNEESNSVMPKVFVIKRNERGKGINNSSESKVKSVYQILSVKLWIDTQELFKSNNITPEQSYVNIKKTRFGRKQDKSEYS